MQEAEALTTGLEARARAPPDLLEPTTLRDAFRFAILPQTLESSHLRQGSKTPSVTRSLARSKAERKCRSTPPAYPARGALTHAPVAAVAGAWGRGRRHVLGDAAQCGAAVALVLALALTACGPGEEPGAARVTIGLITNNRNGLRNVAGFRDAMHALGYVEGERATYLSADKPVPKAQLEGALRDFLAADVDLIFTAGTPTGIAAHRVTTGTGVPVVFGVIADPIAAGVMDDLNRPGGNLTGVKLSQNQARRLQVLRELVPSLRRVFVPYDPEDAAARSAVEQLERVAPDLGVELVRGTVPSREAVAAMLERLPPELDAIFLVPDSTVNPLLPEVLRAASMRGIPVSGPSTAQVEEGAFMTYGFVHRDAGAQAAQIADQILKGTHPGDLPVQTAEFHLGINLDTAAALGIEVTGDDLDRASVIVR